MKKYFSILYCLAALAAGCDDNNKEALAFDLSTDEWSFAKEGGTQNLIVLAPGVWKVSEKPDWCTLIPEGAERSREVKINCSANTGKKREGTLVLTCGDETRTIAVFQQGAYIVKGFPVEWLFTADYYATGKYTMPSSSTTPFRLKSAKERLVTSRMPRIRVPSKKLSAQPATLISQVL